MHHQKVICDACFFFLPGERDTSSLFLCSFQNRSLRLKVILQPCEPWINDIERVNLDSTCKKSSFSKVQTSDLRPCINISKIRFLLGLRILLHFFRRWSLSQRRRTHDRRERFSYLSHFRSIDRSITFEPLNNNTTLQNLSGVVRGRFNETTTLFVAHKGYVRLDYYE